MTNPCVKCLEYIPKYRAKKQSMRGIVINIVGQLVNRKIYTVGHPIYGHTIKQSIQNLVRRDLPSNLLNIKNIRNYRELIAGEKLLGLGLSHPKE